MHKLSFKIQETLHFGIEFYEIRVQIKAEIYIWVKCWNFVIVFQILTYDFSRNT
jgi:hypothetical protein